MKKYKLIKQYPGSDSLGTEITGSKETMYSKGFGYRNYDWAHVETHPEYWEEVIEKDYEILISRVVPQEILSIKRLSDGEVFTVGDLIDLQSILASDLKQDRILEIKIVDNKIRFKMNFQANHGWGSSYTLNFIKKVKQPIFLTHDGKDIFDGDKVWWVNKKTFNSGYFVSTPSVTFFSDINAYFLTKEGAENYIEKKKVLFTTEDGVEVRKDEVVYVVDGRLNSIDMISNFIPKDYPTFKAFSTSKAAENYIVQHKYALSIEDFWEFVCWGGSNIAKSKRLKRLVKERLNLK